MFSWVFLNNRVGDNAGNSIINKKGLNRMRTRIRTELTEIHESQLNGQRKQMVKQINEYGLYDFFADYHEYLFDTYVSDKARYEYFADLVISYHRITADPR